MRKILLFLSVPVVILIVFGLGFQFGQLSPREIVIKDAVNRTDYRVTANFNTFL